MTTDTDTKLPNPKVRPVGRPPREFPRESFCIKVEPEIAEHFRALCSAFQMSQSALFSFFVYNTELPGSAPDVDPEVPGHKVPTNNGGTMS